MSTWIVLAAVGAGSYLLRVSMFVVVGARRLPGWLDEALAMVAPAAVAALVGTMLLASRVDVQAGSTPTFVAVAAGFVAAKRSGNVIWAFAVGLPTMWTLTALG
jgi:branched-subunit amino acid transport protein